jgi:hypothetical protein
MDELAKYKLSFLVGGLYYNESLILANLYQELKDWTLVRKEAMDKNLLQTRMESSSKRMSSEIINKLMLLNKEELDFLINGMESDQKLLLWIATCRRYTFIRDFSIEVVLYNYKNLKKVVNKDEFDIFFNQKSLTHPELDKITELTRNKLRSVMFKNMREAGIIDKSGLIVPTFPSNEFISLLKNTSPEDIYILPISNIIGDRI